MIKPFPANRLEALPGGVGVMADDAMAAVYANLALRAALMLIHGRDRVSVECEPVSSPSAREMLTPFRVDTNSLFITERLNEIGIDVRLKLVAGDDVDELAELLRAALGWADLIVMTGGLGPTEDDITRDAVARLLQVPLDVDETIVDRIRERFQRRGMAMPEINRRQAMVPRGATVLPNPNGTAPGLWLEHGRTAFVLLPGPPREMKPMFEAVVVERLAPRTERGRIVPARAAHHRTDRIGCRRDGAADLRRRGRSQAVPITTTILAVLGQIELHLTARAASRAEARRRARCGGRGSCVRRSATRSTAPTGGRSKPSSAMCCGRRR